MKGNQARIDKDPNQGKVTMEKKYSLRDDPERKAIDELARIKGFYYGQKIVPVPKELENELKYSTAKSLKVLCFIPKREIPRHFFLGSIDLALPSPGKSTQQAFNALVIALKETKKVALIRYATRDNSAPKLAMLVPRR